jgi:alpha-ketoglutarate-dependent taurine dioxygenase
MSTNLKVTPVAGRIGAVIEGVSLAGDLSAETVKAIHEQILKYKVVFFRNQHQLDNTSHEAFAKLFGEPIAHPTVAAKEGTDYTLELDSDRGGRANVWHTDVTFVANYPRYSILRGVVIPEAGGDTVWANTASAYQDLPVELRELTDKLWALHTNEFDYATSYRTKQNYDNPDAAKQYEETFASTVYETEQPVVHVHPETGERHLLLGGFAKNIIGFSSSDSQRFISLLQDHITKLENTVRWHWQAGDVAIWDNHATQHYAVNDYGDQHRVVRRVTIAGEAPFSIDGRRSVSHVKEKRVPTSSGK